MEYLFLIQVLEFIDNLSARNTFSKAVYVLIGHFNLMKVWVTEHEGNIFYCK